MNTAVNVQDIIIIERTKETSISSTCRPIPSTTIAGAGQHPCNTVYAYSPNIGSMSQPIAGSMPVNRIRRWPSIITELSDCPVFALTAIRVTFYPPKVHYPDNTIHWPNCEKPFKPLTTNIIVNISNFILDMFIRFGVQKCQPFPTHSTPLSPK